MTAQYMLTAQDGFSPFAPNATTALGTFAGGRASRRRVCGGLAKIRGPERADHRHRSERRSRRSTASTGKKGSGRDRPRPRRLRSNRREGSSRDDANLKVGDRFSLTERERQETPLGSRDLQGAPVPAAARQHQHPRVHASTSSTQQPRNLYAFTRREGRAEHIRRGRRSTRRSRRFPDAKVQTRKAWIDAQIRTSTTPRSLLYVLLALSVIVSICSGWCNTLVLERLRATRELGMLRAVGMTRNAGLAARPPGERDHRDDRRGARTAARRVPRACS